MNENVKYIVLFLSQLCEQRAYGFVVKDFSIFLNKTSARQPLLHLEQIMKKEGIDHSNHNLHNFRDFVVVYDDRENKIFLKILKTGLNYVYFLDYSLNICNPGKWLFQLQNVSKELLLGTYYYIFSSTFPFAYFKTLSASKNSKL